jgi:hypothetical protein
MPYAENTTVPPERSRAEIEQVLRKYGAEAFSYGYDGERAAIAFRAHGRMLRFEVVVPPLSEFRLRPGSGYRTRTATEQRNARDKSERQRWRALLLVIKAKLEAVATGITSFEEEFLAHILLPDGRRSASGPAASSRRSTPPARCRPYFLPPVPS